MLPSLPSHAVVIMRKSVINPNPKPHRRLFRGMYDDDAEYTKTPEIQLCLPFLHAFPKPQPDLSQINVVNAPPVVVIASRFSKQSVNKTKRKKNSTNSGSRC
jgi:hypothetical protein